MKYNSTVTACQLTSAGGGIPYQAAAPGISLLWHAQLRHATEGVLTQTVTQSARQVLQVSSVSAWPIDLTGGSLLGAHCIKILPAPKHKSIYLQGIDVAVDQYQWQSNYFNWCWDFWLWKTHLRTKTKWVILDTSADTLKVGLHHTLLCLQCSKGQNFFSA